MQTQMHTSLGLVGIGLPTRDPHRAARTRSRPRSVTVAAAIAIEVLIAASLVAMSIGDQRAGSLRREAGPFVTAAPEAPPTPRPGF